MSWFRGDSIRGGTSEIPEGQFADVGVEHNLSSSSPELPQYAFPLQQLSRHLGILLHPFLLQASSKGNCPAYSPWGSGVPGSL